MANEWSYYFFFSFGTVYFTLQLRKSVVDQLRRRGPDGSIDHLCSVGNLNVLACGCVLHMRGPLTLQPAIDAKSRDWLLWNGEVFGGCVKVGIGSMDTVDSFYLLTLLLCMVANDAKQISSIQIAM